MSLHLIRSFPRRRESSTAFQPHPIPLWTRFRGDERETRSPQRHAATRAEHARLVTKKIDDQVPLARRRLGHPTKLTGADSVQRDHMIEPLIGRMREARPRREPGQRDAFRIACRQIEYGFGTSVAHQLALDLPMQRLLL